MASRLGRPRKPASERKVQVSITLLPKDLKQLDKWAKEQNVTRAQVMWDAIRALDGRIQDDLAQLREELDDQKGAAEESRQALEQALVQLKRLQSSQELANTILNPYRSPDSMVPKEAQNKARLLKPFLVSAAALDCLQACASGAWRGPVLEVVQKAQAAFGSYQAVLDAVMAMKEAQEA